MHNLLLCGFMGCGKTTVGKQLAARLSMQYLDLDQEIETQAGMRIPEIFAQDGEAGFREREHQAVCALAKRQRCVVALGGGAMTFSRNAKAVAAGDTVVFLDVPFEVCYRRIQGSDRPLVRSHTKAELHALYEMRRIAYRAAAQVTIEGAYPAAQMVQLVAQAWMPQME